MPSLWFGTAARQWVCGGLGPALAARNSAGNRPGPAGRAEHMGVPGRPDRAVQLGQGPFMASRSGRRLAGGRRDRAILPVRARQTGLELVLGTGRQGRVGTGQMALSSWCAKGVWDGCQQRPLRQVRMKRMRTAGSCL